MYHTPMGRISQVTLVSLNDQHADTRKFVLIELEQYKWICVPMTIICRRSVPAKHTCIGHKFLHILFCGENDDEVQ